MSGYDTTTNHRDLATHYSPFWWSQPSGLSTQDAADRWQAAVRQAKLNPDDTSGTPATAPATDIPTMIVRPASAVDPTAQAQSNPDHRKAGDATSQLPPDLGDDGGDSPGWVASAFRSTFGHVDPNQWAAQGAAAGGASGALVGAIAGGAGGGLGGAGAGTLVAPGVGTVGGGVAGGIAGATEGAAAGGVAGAVAGGLIGKAAGAFIVYMEGEKGAANAPQSDTSRSAGPQAPNRAEFQNYSDTLRRDMGQPATTDPKLSGIMNETYRPNAKIGSGSTADAVRSERATGQPTGGRWHTQKAEETIVRLQNWLTKNPTASPGDRAAAENVLRDLQNALAGK